ncbi:MAG: hypothetical protein ACLFR1_09815 [Spirochaetia bacterium]
MGVLHNAVIRFGFAQVFSQIQDWLSLNNEAAANLINAVSKDNPDTALTWCENWKEKNISRERR